MSCTIDQKSVYDWAVAVTPIFISAAVGVIGYFQYAINKSKFRLDLYNRRFSIYEKSLEYFQSYYSRHSDPEAVERSSKGFIRAYRESVFLFGADSNVYKTLTELKDTLGFLLQFNEKFKSEPYDKDECKAYSNIKSSKREPYAIMESLELELLPWLDFQKIEK